MNYINNQSFRCLLGVQSKDIQIVDNLFLWKVGKKQHFAVEGALTDDNIAIIKQYIPSNFHYLSESNLSILKQHFIVNKSKHTSVILDISDLSFSGSNGKSIRHCLNRCQKENFSLESNYRKLDDVKDLIDEWSNNYTFLYFRDNSGKNYHFYKNNFHHNLISLFVYKNANLVAFGTLSQPINGYSSYILGKALYQRHYGLSEFTDVELYKLGQSHNVKFINMGDAPNKGLLGYKTKFKNYTELHFDGNVEGLKK